MVRIHLKNAERIPKDMKQNRKHLKVRPRYTKEQ